MTIHFHDVSHHNGDYQPAGPTIAKATEGSAFVDGQFTTTRARTLAGGWPFLAYHFLRSGNIAAQVGHALQVVGRGPLMLDVETAIDGSKASWLDTQTFIDAYGRAGGRCTLAYIPPWYWRDAWGSPDLRGLTNNGVGLISSRYVTTYSPVGPGWAPYGGVAPAIWQWTDKPLDTNAWRGTMEGLRTLFANGTREDNSMADYFAIREAGPKQNWAGRFGGGTYELAASMDILTRWQSVAPGVTHVVTHAQIDGGDLGVNVAKLGGGAGGVPDHRHELGGLTGPVDPES